MPKKTKLQKQHAQLRRLQQEHLHTVQQSGPAVTTPAPTNVQYSFKSVATASRAPIVDSKEDVAEYQAIKKDLSKTVIIALIAIVSEVLIAWKLHAF